VLKKLGISAAGFFCFAFLVTAQYPPRPPKPTPEQLAAEQQGKTLFQQNCAVCHGENLTGGRGPDLIRSVLTRHDKDGDLIGPVIMQGSPEKGMPAFTQLSQSEIADIVAYIHAQIVVFDLHTRIPGGYPNDIPASQLATGSAEAGKAFFYGAGHCSECHSPTGDLAHIASRYPDPTDLEQRFIDPSGNLVFGASNPKTVVTATVTLKDGKTLEGPVLQNGDGYVSIRGSDGWTHTWPSSDVKSVVEHNPTQAHIDMIPKWTNKEMHDMFTYLETLK
jgi:cytochrome c oxidase cbb3-type subunit 3